MISSSNCSSESCRLSQEMRIRKPRSHHMPVKCGVRRLSPETATHSPAAGVRCRRTTTWR
jgi:hypothetical protein